MEEDQETVKYQKLESGCRKYHKKNGDQYMNLFMLHFLKKQIFFQNIFRMM